MAYQATWCAAVFDVPPGRTGEVIGGNYGGFVRHGDPEMVERILVQFLAV